MGINDFNPKKWSAYLSNPAILRYATLIAALFISLFLAIAAFGKIFYPVEKIKDLDAWTSVFEILLIGFLFTFRMRKAFWLGAAILFACWGGYAIYWCCLKLPCSCMGTMIALPSTYALCLDALFFVGSCAMAWMLGALRSVLYLILLCAFFGGLIGYAFAEWVFYVKIIGVIWRLS
jgi:hypothetical protein